MGVRSFMRHSAVFVSAIAIAMLLARAAPAHIFLRPPGPPVLDVPAGRAVLVTTIDATAAARPVTAALVLAIPVQADADHNRSASEALATLIRSLVPRAPVWVEPLPMPPRPNAGRFFGGPPYAGFVHVGVPANDDRALRATLDRIDTA